MQYFSFAPFAAIILWITPAIITGLIVSRWKILPGFSGGVVQSIGMYLALVIMVETILGYIGLLTYLSVLVCFIVLLLITILTTPRQVLGSFFNLNRWRLVFIGEIESLRIELGNFLWLFVPIVLIFTALTLDKLFSPPTQVDCLWGLLPQVIGWLKTHSIFEHSSPVAYFHQSSLLVAFWTIIPFDTDLFINLQNIPAILLVSSAIYHLPRLLGVDRKLSSLAAMAFISLPAVTNFIWTQKPDILLSAFFVMSMCLFVAYIRYGNNAALVCALGSTGLTVSSKTSGLYYGIFLFIVILIFSLIKTNLRKWLFLFIGSIFSLLFALIWPFRNWLIWGNPFYPMTLKMFNHILFLGSGYLSFGNMEAVMGTSILANMRPEVIPLLLYATLVRFGLTGLIGLVAVIMAVFVFFWKYRRDWLFLFIEIVAFGTYVCFLFLPAVAGNTPGSLDMLKQATDIYYAMPFFAMAMIVLIVMASRTKSNFLRRLLEILFFVQISLSLLLVEKLDQSRIVLTQGVIIFIFSMIMLGYLLYRHRKWFLLITGIIITLLSSGVIYKYADGFRVKQRYLNSDFGYFSGVSSDLINWMDQNVDGKRIVIIPMVDGNYPDSYPFWGPRFTNSTVMGPVFTRTYQPPENTDVVLVTGRTGQNNLSGWSSIPPWAEEWGANRGFKLAFTNGIEAVFFKK